MLSPETQNYLASNTLKISLFEYFLLRFKEPGKPAYLNHTTVEQLISTPEWDKYFIVLFNTEIKLVGPGQLLTLPKDTVFQTWLVEDYQRSLVNKDNRQKEEALENKAQIKEIEALTKELHTQLIKVRSVLLQKGARETMINDMIELAVNPYSVLGKDYILANPEGLTVEQKARVQKGFEMRKKFGLVEILTKLGR